VLGQVGTPGRYPVESNTTIFDLLAQAGGIHGGGSDIVYIIRLDKDGKEIRYPVDLKGLANGSGSIHAMSLQGGDSVFVPKAEQFSIYGEVTDARAIPRRTGNDGDRSHRQGGRHYAARQPTPGRDQT